VACWPLIVPTALIVYVPSGSALPAESVGVQPTGIVPADCLPRSIVLTIWPAEFFTTTCRSLTEFASCTPNAPALPLATDTELPGASTVEPISSAACDC